MSVQCLGKTRAGSQCSRKVNDGRYCHQHLSQDPQYLSNISASARNIPSTYSSLKAVKSPHNHTSNIKPAKQVNDPSQMKDTKNTTPTKPSTSFRNNFMPFSPLKSQQLGQSLPKKSAPTLPKSPTPRPHRTVDYTKPGYIYVYTLASLLDNSKDGWLKTRNLLTKSKDKDRWVTFKSKSLLLILVKVGMTTQTVAKRIQQWESKCQHKLVCLHPEYKFPGSQSGTFLEKFRGLTLSAQKTSAQFRQYTTFQDNIKGFFVPRDVLRAEKEIHDELKQKFGRGDVYCTGCVEKANAEHKESSVFDLLRKKDFMQSDYNVHVEWFPIPKNRLHEVYKIIDRICLRYLP